MSPEEFAASLLSSPLLSEYSESNVDKSSGKAMPENHCVSFIIIVAVEEEIKISTIPQQTGEKLN